MKKTIGFCMALLLAAFGFLPALQSPAAAAAARIPVINVEGEKYIMVYNEDGTSYCPTEEKADEILNAAIEELAPLFAAAYLTNHYELWSARALELLTPIYDEIRPAPDGTLPEHTGPDFTPLPLDDLPAPEAVNWYYVYAWDYRLSPLDAADGLHAYIQAVKARTGAGKVVLSSRCGSTSIGAAYLYKYGVRDLAKIVFTSSTLLGAPHVDALLSGNVSIPGDALYHYLKYQDILGSVDERAQRFVYAMLNALNLNGSADDTIRLLTNVYGKIKDSFVAPFMRSFYGIGGNYVSFAGAHYGEYRDYIFPTQELKDEYAAILAKSDEYHYNVQEKLEELIAAAREDGVPTYVLAFYGEPSGYPISERSDLVGDELCDAGWQSLGATVAAYPQTLSEDYIAAREAAGLGAYISPDGQIDASTCMLPETTWFIKNMRHQFFANDLHDFIRRIAWTDGFTVDSDPAYPRFLAVKGNHAGLIPAQAVNEGDVDPVVYQTDMSGVSGFLARLIAFFARITAFFARIFGVIE